MENPSTEPFQKDKCRKVSALQLVDSWAQPSSTGPSSPKFSSSCQRYSSPSAPPQVLSPQETFPNEHRNYVPNGKFAESGDNSRVAYRSRNESDPIDRGVVPIDALHGKVESLEDALDQIYCKMKTELRDVRDSLKSVNRYTECSGLLSPSRTNNTPSFSYQRTSNQVDV